MAFSPSVHSTLPEAAVHVEDYTDGVLAILDLLNLKIVERCPTDQDYREDTVLVPAQGISKPRNRICSTEEKVAEVTKWKHFAEQAESRFSKAQENLDKSKKAYDTLRSKLKSDEKRQQEWRRRVESFRKQTAELKERLGQVEKENWTLSTDLAQQKQIFGKEREDCLQQKQKLITDHRRKMREMKEAESIQRRNICQHHSLNKELEAKVENLQRTNRKLTQELEQKAFYLKEVERLIEQHQQVLRNSKERHKKEKDEMQQQIVDFELNVAAKHFEIEKLTAALECKK